jgi:hypothetical protein
MAANQLDAVNMAAVPVGGMIHEDLMDAIFDVSPVDRPFCDAIGTDTSGNTYKEWTREALEASSKDNARIDGSDSTGLNDTETGERLGNYHQIMSKTVRVSDRGRNVNSVGSADELIRQLIKRQKALRRDEEAALMSRNIAVPGNGTSVAGKLAGVGGWIGVKVLDVASTTSDRGATGADPVLTGDGSGGGGYPDTIAVDATAQAISEATIKAMMQAAYENGGDPTMLISVPTAIQLFSDWLFNSSARVATLQSYVDQGNRTTNRSGGGVAAQGAVNIFVTNFGTLELVPDRFQPNSGTNKADMYLIDPTTWERSYLQGYETKELARTGLGENREITVDVTLVALNPEANAVVADCNLATAAVA